MRNHLAESLCIGGLIGVAVLLIHVLTANAAPQIQLLALLAAACLVACCQIAFTIWYERRGIPSGSSPDDQATNFLRFRRNRRNPFFRELTSDWTGLDEHFADDRAAGAPRARAAGDQARTPAKHPQSHTKER